jgi:hypothetical protein
MMAFFINLTETQIIIQRNLWSGSARDKNHHQICNQPKKRAERTFLNYSVEETNAAA